MNRWRKPAALIAAVAVLLGTAAVVTATGPSKPGAVAEALTLAAAEPVVLDAAAPAPAPRSLSLAEAQELAVANDPQIALARLDAIEAELAVAELDDAPAGPRFVPPWEMLSPYPWSLMQEQYARAAKQSQLRLATLTEQQAAVAVQQAVEQAYLDVLSAEEKLKAAKAGLEAASSQLRAAEAGLRAGTVSRLDVAQAEHGAESAAVAFAAAERQLESARMALNSRLGLDLDTPLTLTTRFSAPAAPAADVRADVDQALRRRLEIVSAREQTALAELYMENARKSFGDGSSLPTYKQAERDLERARLRQSQQEAAIALQVRQSYLSLQSAYDQVMIEQAAVRLAEQAFDASVVRLQAGLISQHQAAEAQASLTRAHSSAAEALYRYNLALAQYRQATGADLPEPDQPA